MFFTVGRRWGRWGWSLEFVALKVDEDLSKGFGPFVSRSHKVHGKRPKTQTKENCRIKPKLIIIIVLVVILCSHYLCLTISASCFSKHGIRNGP